MPPTCHAKCKQFRERDDTNVTLTDGLRGINFAQLGPLATVSGRSGARQGLAPGLRKRGMSMRPGDELSRVLCNVIQPFSYYKRPPRVRSYMYTMTIPSLSPESNPHQCKQHTEITNHPALAHFVLPSHIGSYQPPRSSIPSQAG